MTPGFLPGDELVHPSTKKALYQVKSVIPRIQRVKVLDLENRDEKLLDEAELRMQLVSGQLRVWRHGADREEVVHARSEDEDQAAHEALQFLQEILNLARQYEVTFRRAYFMLVKEVLPAKGQNTLKPLSLSQAYRLWERERNGMPVRLANANKGNREPRYAPEVYDYIKEQAEELLLQTQSRWTMRTLTERINQLLHERGFLPKQRDVSRELVKRVIRTQVQPNPERDRMEPGDAISALAVASKPIRIDGMFVRVEQDALHLPWLLRTPYGDSDKVYLVHAIDCCTSIPLGWCLVIGAPRVPDTLKCIETILFPKHRRWEELSLKYDFDIYGTPSMVVVDNGPENKGARVMRVSRLSITLNRLKARHAHRKPFIERLNKSLKEYLETLPGCTRVDGKDGQRDPAALGDPVMKLEEMERWIVRFYFEHWVNHRLDRLEKSIFIENKVLGNTPLQRYRALVEERGYPIPLPPSVHAWRSTIYDHELRTLSRKTGISYGNYHFRGERLPYLLGVFGETEIRVMVDPDDFRCVYVMDLDERTLVPLVNDSTSEITPAYSYDEAAALLAEAAAAGVDVTSEALRREVFNRSVERAPKVREGRKGQGSERPSASKAAKSKEVTTQARRHAAVERSALNPLPPRLPVLGHPPLGSTDDELVGARPLKVIDRRTGEIRP